jgi:hypothetical protein
MGKRNKAIVFGSLILALSLVVGSRELFGATCTGADPCNACKNCKYCKHCAKEGGKCGVCKAKAQESSGR